MNSNEGVTVRVGSSDITNGVPFTIFVLGFGPVGGKTVGKIVTQEGCERGMEEREEFKKEGGGR